MEGIRNQDIDTLTLEGKREEGDSVLETHVWVLLPIDISFPLAIPLQNPVVEIN